MDVRYNRESNLGKRDCKIIDTIKYNGRYVNSDVFKRRALSLAAVGIGLASVAAVVLF